MQPYTSIDNHPGLDVRNVEALPKCKGANFLLCIFAPNNETLIAKSWHRKYPTRKAGEAVVMFNGHNGKGGL